MKRVLAPTPELLANNRFDGYTQGENDPKFTVKESDEIFERIKISSFAKS